MNILVQKAEALLQKLHDEYPERLPRYIEDAAEELLEAIDAAKNLSTKYYRPGELFFSS